MRQLPAQEMCSRCVMDTSDPEIIFDHKGVCSHCHRAALLLDGAAKRMGEIPSDTLFKQLRQQNRNKSKFDCIIGLSGGLDSSYVLLKAVEAGVRPLVVHIDGGWNTEIAVTNIRCLISALGTGLVTSIIDWDEMRALQVAYLRSGLANQDVPQDHAFFASLYLLANKYGIRTVVTGSNIASESVLPTAWEYDAMDGFQVRMIARMFGAELNQFPILTSPRYYAYHVLLRGMRILRPLNHMRYVRKEVIGELAKLGWRDYGGKHRESVFTNWFQHVYLLERLKIDKRRAHLSSLIASGQMLREDALAELEQPALNPEESRQLESYVCKKLNVRERDLRAWMAKPERRYTEFPNHENLIRNLAKNPATRILRKMVHF